MTLRQQTVVIIAITLVGLIAILAAVSRLIVLSSFAELEARDARQKLSQVLNALDDDRIDLETTTQDWAAWDETYAFVTGERPLYAQDNLADVPFENLRIDVMLFLDSSGRPVFGKAVDLHGGQAVSIPTDLARQVACLQSSALLGPRFNAGDSTTGFMLLPEGPLMVALHPIVTSSETGPVGGLLALGRYLDAAQIERLGSKLGLSLGAYRIDRSDLSTDLQQARALLSGDRQLWVHPLNEQMTAGYTLLYDLNQEPALLLRLETPRDIYQQGRRSISYFLVAFLSTGLAFGLVGFGLLERGVTSRLVRLTRSISQIGRDRAVSARVPASGRDELAMLGTEINTMLGELEHADDEIRRARNGLERRVMERTVELSRSNAVLWEEIAARRRLEEQIEQRRVYLESVLSCTPDAIVTVDGDGNVLEWNPGAVRLFGYTEGEAIGCNIDSLVAAADSQMFAHATSLTRLVLSGQTILPLETVRYRKDGSAVDVILAGSPMRTRDRLCGLVVAYTDISEVKQRTRELATLLEASRALSSTLELEAVLSCIAEQMVRVTGADGCALSRWDRASNSVITWVEWPCRRPEPDGVSNSFSLDLYPETRRVLETRNPLAIRVTDVQADPAEVEYLRQSGIGSLLMLPLAMGSRMIGLVELDRADAARGFTPGEIRLCQALADQAAVAIENAALFDQLEKTVSHLQELDILKSQFIQNVSHELRTPLALVRGYAELLEMGELGELNPDQFKAASIISQRSVMLSSLVEGIMLMEEASTRPPQPRPVQLDEATRSVLDDFHVAAKRASLQLVADIATGVAPVKSTGIYIRRVLDNLLHNAIKFTPAGGTITVRVWGTADRGYLEVADTGIGIPADKLDRVFDRFYQVDGGTARRHDGAGLGLALVKELTEAMGGQVWVKSEVGQGAAFTVALPVYADEGSEPAPPASGDVRPAESELLPSAALPLAAPVG